MRILNSKSRDFFSKIVLLFCSFIIVLFVAEVVTRIVAPQSGTNKCRWLYKNNGILGYSMRENLDSIYKDRYRKYRITTNSKGLRSPETSYSKPDGVYRIVVLGDSFTFGHGVNDHETFSRCLDRRLNSGKRKYEVINAGVSGYGSWEQLEWLKTEGYKYNPDLIITAFCENNDFLDNYIAVIAEGHGKFRREVKGGLLVEVKFESRRKKKNNEKDDLRSSLNPVWRFIVIHSHLRELILKRLFFAQVRYGIKARDSYLPEDFFWINVLKKKYSTAEEKSVYVTENLLLKTSEFVSSIDAQYLVILIPSIESVDERAFSVTLKELKLNKDDYDMKKVDGTLEPFCLSKGIPLIKLCEHLNSSMYFPLNRHLNKSGNERVAMVLAEYIKSRCQ